MSPHKVLSSEEGLEGEGGGEGGDETKLLI